MFTWTGTPLRTREQIATVVHQVARDLGLDDLATVIALMTISTEVGTGTGDQRVWWCPANPLSIVAESLSYPHDSLSNDNRSMGYFQQQPGPDGQPWWGTVADMMTLETAARSFLGRLDPAHVNAKGAYAAGVFAQQVQGSAFPDRYAHAWDEAKQVLARALNTGGLVSDIRPAYAYGITRIMHGFNPTTCAACTGNSNGPRNNTRFVVIHTQEGDGTAVSLANYLNSTSGATGVSYNLVVDATDTIEVVPVTEGPWAAAEANAIAVHLCFAGSRAAWTRDQWLTHDAALHRAAKAAAAACRQFNIPAVKVLSTNGWPVTPAGIAGHADFGRRGGGHHDPGEFVWPEFIQMVQDELAPTPSAPEEPMPNPKRYPQDYTDRELLEDIAVQLRGPGGNGWPQLNGRTLVDSQADVALHQNMPGYMPPKKAS